MLMIFALALASGCAARQQMGGAGGGSSGAEFQVNPFLWRASLEVVSFMPLASSDTVGGVINTEWFAEQPNERFKMTIYILDSALRVDGLKVSVFRQVRRGGRWQTAAINPGVARAVENLILTKARQLRLGYETAQ